MSLYFQILKVLEMYACTKIDKLKFEQMTEEERDEFLRFTAKEFAQEMNAALFSKILPLDYLFMVRTL